MPARLLAPLATGPPALPRASYFRSRFPRASRMKSRPWSGDRRAVYETLERKRVSADNQATIFKAGTYVVPDVMKARPSLKKRLASLPLRSAAFIVQWNVWRCRSFSIAPNGLTKSSLMATALWPINLIEVSDYFLATTNRSTINIQTSSKLSAGFQKIRSSMERLSLSTNRVVRISICFRTTRTLHVLRPLQLFRESSVLGPI